MSSPWPVGNETNMESLFRCTWRINVNSRKSVKIIIKYLILDFHKYNTLAFFDGDSNKSPLIANYSGRLTFSSFQSKTNQLFVEYSGKLKYAQSSEFEFYFEESDPEVQCQNGSYSCRNKVACFSDKDRCDSFDHCKDGTDEENCSNENKNFNFKCGQRNMDNLRVVGGRASQPGSWPWMVSMRLRHREPNGHTCGGSILNRNFIVTAAHCVKEYPNAEDWTILGGKYQRLVHDDTEVIRYVKNISVHPLFIGDPDDDDNANLTWYDTRANDIAIIELNAPWPDGDKVIRQVCLPKQDLEHQAKNMSFVLGWGETYETGGEFVLKEAIIPLITNEQCTEWFQNSSKNKTIIGPRMICAGYEKGGQDACQVSAD